MWGKCERKANKIGGREMGNLCNTGRVGIDGIMDSAIKAGSLEL